MQGRVEFDVIRQTPTLAHYRRDRVPAAGLGPAGSWVGAVVSDAGGRQYRGVRGCDDFVTGMTTHVVSPICGFRALPDRLDLPAPHLFAEYSTLDWFEPMRYHDTGAAVALSFTATN
ncbi:hypothetical protein [Mycolicibacterium thermoresistibile]|uniref:Uncharacterized protein n=2 Tax=Mycolicibacterium thermoresistibile TaxID=1797 RepID=G7CN27_MYCT3|nr:hypothetical protein [Mycolicibacterium thermoresistibile]EHI10516.1 hypothetical protein KEK_22124 [Mycolicibacterium thermoresistibile ATCC 19527]GAT15432.1 putative uncharacterized protein [Mycolicibacterium thermoresistibile]SNW17491.1 Uncharacterised protein [Mycolicibacterium thermoresistibile]